MNFDGANFCKTALNLQPAPGASETQFYPFRCNISLSFLYPACVFVLKCRSTFPMLRTSAFFCAEFSRKWFGNSRVRQSASTFKFSHYNADQSRSSWLPYLLPPDHLWKTDFYRIVEISMHTDSPLPHPISLWGGGSVISFDLSREEWSLLEQTIGQSRQRFQVVITEKIVESLGRFSGKIRRNFLHYYIPFTLSFVARVPF